MNAVVVRLTLRSLLGARRVLVPAGLPLVLLGLAVLVRVFAGGDDVISAAVVLVFGLGTVTPLLGLIAGTGSIGPEIGDGSIIYLLAKPLRRGSIVASKLVTASIVAVLFAALPTYAAGVILTGDFAGLAWAA
ncbi:MAG: ABC transporter permease, partial [Thermoleophilia bacterium]|nr:ABC transporter permease [Thermoleophilia bacterium]